MALPVSGNTTVDNALADTVDKPSLEVPYETVESSVVIRLPFDPIDDPSVVRPGISPVIFSGGSGGKGFLVRLLVVVGVVAVVDVEEVVDVVAVVDVVEVVDVVAVVNVVEVVDVVAETGDFDVDGTVVIVELVVVDSEDVVMVHVSQQSALLVIDKQSNGLQIRLSPYSQPEDVLHTFKIALIHLNSFTLTFLKWPRLILILDVSTVANRSARQNPKTTPPPTHTHTHTQKKKQKKKNRKASRVDPEGTTL